METLFLIIKGFFLGVANIIPGVSGGTLAITLGIYERLLKTISHLFKDFKENLKFIVPIGIGAVIAIGVLAKVISYCLTNFAWATTLFFIGLILGGIPLLWKKVSNDVKSPKNWLIFGIFFVLVSLFAFLKTGNVEVSLVNVDFLGYLKLFGVGLIAAATMVIPGISGSFVLMMLGYYQPIINKISEFFTFSNIIGDGMILGFFGVGVLVGIVLVAKLLEYLFSAFEKETYFAVFGFIFASIIGIIKPLLGVGTNPLEIVIGIVLFLIGTVVAYKLGEK